MSGSANNDGPSWRVIAERLTPHLTLLYQVERVLYSGRTKYQEVDIVVLKDLGKALFLDGKIQSAEGGEWVYHEALVHPALVTHPAPRRVLIIGGGEGATLREVLKHNAVEQATMVDIDREVVELCKRYLPEMHRGSFDDPRVNLIFADGRKFVAEAKNEFDIIIVDATDPLEAGPSYLLYTEEFYRLVRGALREGGIVVTQATAPFHTPRVFATIYNTVRQVFPVTRAYTVWVPCFHMLWGFVLGSLRYDPLSLSPDEVDRRLAERGVSGLRFYDGRMHRSMFELPKYVAEVLERETAVAHDDSPVFVPP